MKIRLVKTYATFAPDVVHRCLRWIRLSEPEPLHGTSLENDALAFISDLLETWIRRLQDSSCQDDVVQLNRDLDELERRGLDFPHLASMCLGLPREVRHAYHELGVYGEEDALWQLDDLVHGVIRERAVKNWEALGACTQEAEDVVQQRKDLELLRRNLLSNVTHELRTPLSGILGYGEILEEELTGKLSPEQHDLLQRILADGYRLRELINSMLDMSQITSGNLALDLQPLDLGLILQPACEQLLETAEAKLLTIILEIPSGLPMVRGDPNYVFQIVANLLSNAVKFTPPGGRISVQACLRSGAEWLKDPNSRADAVVVDISDTGIGLAPEKLSMLFTSFYQADPSATRQFGGMGLGLSLVKSLVELHGGRVWAESKLGQGSTFSFSLPAWTSEDKLV